MAEEFSVLTDLEGCLSAVSDDARAIVGRADSDICAHPLFDLFLDEDREIAVEALQKALSGDSVKLSGVRVRVEGAHQPRFDIAVEPGGPDKFYFFFTLAAGEAPALKPESKKGFLEKVAERSGAANVAAGRMMMVDFAGLRSPDLLSRLGEEGARAVQASVEQALAAKSADGKIGELGEGSYGIASGPDDDTNEVVASVVSAAATQGVDAEALDVRIESIALDGEEADTETLNRQLSHVCNKFQQTVESGGSFGLEQLSEAESEINEAVKFIEMALERGDVTVSSREVRQLQSGDVSFQLVKGALIFGNTSVSADRLLVMADHPELCTRYDRAVVEAAIRAFPNQTVFIDIGLPTLASGEAVRISAEYSLQNKFIGFRPDGIDLTAKRSPVVKEVDQLLKAGIHVWLTDFSSAIAKSRQLRGAYVEIGAGFLRDIISQPDRNTLMAGLLKVWQEVDVNLVAVDLNTDDLRSFAHQLGVAYGVGAAANPTAVAS